MTMSASLLHDVTRRKADDVFMEWVKRRSKVVYFDAMRKVRPVLSAAQDTPELALIGSVCNLAGPPGHPTSARLALSARALPECQFEAHKPPTEND